MLYSRRKPAVVKTTYVLLFGLLGSLLLTACGNSPTSAPATSSAPTAATTKGTEPVTLTFGWWENTPEKNQAYRDWLDQFERTHPGIKIKSEFLKWDAYWDKLALSNAAGGSYDIVGLCTCQAANFFDSKALLDLNQFSDLPQVVGGLTPEPVKLFNWNKAQYGLPVGIALSVLGYNKTLLEAAGVTPPDPVKPLSFEEFKTIGRKLTKIENGKVTQYALHPASGDRMGWHTWVSMRGGQVFDNYINPTKMTINTPEGIQGLKDYLSLIEEKIMVPPDEWTRNAWGEGGISSLTTGKIAMTDLGPWDFIAVTSKQLAVGIAPYPVTTQPALRASANGYGISKFTKYPKEAWEFLKWTLEAENQLNFAKFSDIPAEKKALSQLETVIKPKEFAPTLVAQLPAFKPFYMSAKADLQNSLEGIVYNMARGLLTPEQAAAELEKTGNAILTKK